MGNHISLASSKTGSHINLQQSEVTPTTNYSTSDSLQKSYKPALIESSAISDPIFEASASSVESKKPSSNNLKDDDLPPLIPKEHRPRSYRGKIPKGTLAESRFRDPLCLEVPASDEIHPSPKVSPQVLHKRGHFSPFLARHFAVPVPDKALFGRSAFQSPITNKLSGPFRMSSPMKTCSPANRRPLSHQFGSSNSRGFHKVPGLHADSPHC